MLHQRIPERSSSVAALKEMHLVPFDEAVRRLRAETRPLGVEMVPILDADGRRLSKPVFACRPSPMCAVSAMDGYAVRDDDLAVLPARLAIVGKSFAGAGFGGSLLPGQCVRIFTGAPLPANADRVVVQEDVSSEGAVICFTRPLAHRRHVRAAGSDFRLGEMLLEEGTKLGPLQLVAAAAADRDHIEVYRRPAISILCCGDELSPPGSAGPSRDRVPESISFAVAALARRWGGTIVSRDIVPDDLPTICAVAARAVSSSDVVVVVGGASVGEKDFAKAAFSQCGMTTLFDKVAMKPGKPVWFGRAANTFVAGLPGNPTSALVTARLLLAPLIAGLSGGPMHSALDWRQWPVHEHLDVSEDRDTFGRARWDGEKLCLLRRQDSADQLALAQANTLVRVRAGSPAAPAMEKRVEFIDF